MIGAGVLSLLALSCFAFLTVTLGSRWLRLFKLAPLALSEQAAFGLPLGLGVFAYALFGLGSAGLVSAWVVLLLIGVTIAFSWRECASVASNLVGFVHRFPERLRAAPSWHVGVFVLLSLIAGLNLIGALAPPTMMDGLRYLGGVREYISRGRIEFIPVFWWNYPGLYETLFTGALLLRLEAMPALLHWMACVASTVTLFQIGRQFYSTSAGMVAALAYYTMPIAIDRSTAPKSELALAMFGIVSVYAIILWLQQENSSWLWVSAIMAGLQASTKLQGLGPMVASCGAALVAVIVIKRRQPREAVLLLAQYILIAGLVGCPWYVRNWLASGDPIWPMGYGMFASRFWTEANYIKFSAWQRGVGGGLWNYLTGLWSVTQSYSTFGDIRVATSPIFLIFVPAISLVWRLVPSGTRKVILICLVYAWVHYSLWFLRYQHSGYLSFFWPEMALVSGIVAVLLTKLGRLAHVAVRWAVLAYLPLGLVTSIVFNSQFVPVVFGSQSRGEFLAQRVYYFKDIEWLNENLPDDSKLLYMPLQAFYYLDRNYMVAHANYQGFFDYDQYSSTSEFLADLCAHGVTHIFWTSGEEAQPATLVTQLVEEGWLRDIYHNQQAREILSRTFRQERFQDVAIYLIEYDPEVCVGHALR